MNRLIGVMGGMFDPVHRGHIEAATTALDRLGLHELRLIPCATPNHRAQAVASGDHRLAMLELAARADARLLVDDRELRRPGTSYTVDTLMSLREDLPGSTLVLLLGEDAFAGLPQWHRWRELFRLCHICVVNRPMADAGAEASGGEALSEEASGDELTEIADSQQLSAELPAELAQELALRLGREAADLRSSDCGRIYLLAKRGLAIASSDLRARLQQGAGGPVELDEAVSHYIVQHDLYRS